MSHSAGEFQSENSSAGGLSLQSPLAVLSAFAVSLLLHTGLIMVLLIWGVQGCGDGSMIVSEGETRLVGIYVKPSRDDIDKQNHKTDSTETQNQKQDARNTTLTNQNLQVAEVPPVEIRLPQRAKTIGLGSAAPSFSKRNPSDVVRPNDRMLTSPSVKGLGPGEVSFFNAKDKGTRIVFVIDTSSSMYESIRFALAELSASIQSLRPNQFFQVVFYDSTSRALQIRGSKENKLYRAGQFVKTLALQEIANVSIRGGTDHRAALTRAINMDPEIIFLLTDAETLLQARDLDAIRRQNRGRIRIHCIEFGEGPNLSDRNFLKKLARENGGTYRYRDIKQF